MTDERWQTLLQYLGAYMDVGIVLCVLLLLVGCLLGYLVAYVTVRR